MKWLLLALGAVILFWFLRRIGQQQSSITQSANPLPPTQSPVAAESSFAGRPPMPFDEFYNQYYAGTDIDRAFVAQVLQFISKAGGVPAELLRPEDRLDSFPKISKWLQFGQGMLETGLRRRAAGQGIAMPEIHLETIDDVIRQLEPHHLEAFKMHGIGNS
jgi:hypothetical protein